MIVSQAKAAARDWVTANTRRFAGFKGALFHGSMIAMPEDSPWSGESDVDLLIVTSEPGAMEPCGKVLVDDLLLEITPLAVSAVDSAEKVLSNYRLAGSFRAPSIISDPFKALEPICVEVTADFANERWVRRRIADAERNARQHLDTLDANAPLANQATSVLFGAGVLTHLLLVAGLENPTVRRRYVTAGQLLHQYGMDEMHEQLLTLLGSQTLSRKAVERHFETMTEAFDTAAALDRSPFFFASDLSEIARPIAIQGTKAMIDTGFHREAMFWIAVTWTRCMQVFEHSFQEPALFAQDFANMLEEIGIVGPSEIETRKREVLQHLPIFLEAATRIVASNPEVIQSSD